MNQAPSQPCHNWDSQQVHHDSFQVELLNLAGILHAETNSREARRAVIFGDLQNDVITHAHANKLDAEMPLRALRAELAAELHISERAVSALSDLGYLISSMPTLQQTWLYGLLTSSHVKIIADAITELRHARLSSPDCPDTEDIIQLANSLTQYALLNPPHTLRRKSRELLEVAKADSAIARHREAAKGRCITISPAADGMAWLSALLPAPEAVGIYDRTRQIAHSLKQCDGEDRNLGQLQTDVYSDLLIHGTVQAAHPDTCTGTGTGTGTGNRQQATGNRQQATGNRQQATGNTTHCSSTTASTDPLELAPHQSTQQNQQFALRTSPGVGTGVRANVTITVPALSLLETQVAFQTYSGSAKAALSPAQMTTDNTQSISNAVQPKSTRATPFQTEVAELEGYGPIDAETAHRLAAASKSWHRILTHPVTGVRLVYDRETYRPPAELRNYLKLQDSTCRFPGCSRPAKNCELDHVIDWHWNGPTNAENLASLCRSHHVLKHNSRWRVKHIGGRALRWTSPNGNTYLTHPKHRANDERDARTDARTHALAHAHAHAHAQAHAQATPPF